MSFHLFSTRKARQALRQGAVSPADEHRYWLASLAMGLFYLYHSGWIGLEHNWFFLYDVAMALAIFWTGSSEAFKANGGGQGQDLLKRTAVLGVPLGATVLLASQALYWLSWHAFPRVIDNRTFKNPEFAWQVVNFFLFHSLQIWFWWRLHHHLLILNKDSHV